MNNSSPIAPIASNAKPPSRISRQSKRSRDGSTVVHSAQFNVIETTTARAHAAAPSSAPETVPRTALLPSPRELHVTSGWTATATAVTPIVAASNGTALRTSRLAVNECSSIAPANEASKVATNVRLARSKSRSCCFLREDRAGMEDLCSKVHSCFIERQHKREAWQDPTLRPSRSGTSTGHPSAPGPCFDTLRAARLCWKQRDMANHKSAIKRIRQTARRYERNKAGRTELRSKLKAFRAAAAGASEDEVGALLNPTVSLVDKSVQKGILHRNKANRIKSSLAQAANRVNSAS